MSTNENKQLRLAFDIENARITVTVSHGFFGLERRTPTSTVHSHTAFEAHTVMEGETVMHTDGGDYKLSEGDSLILPPGLLHKSIVSDGAFIRTSFYFTFREIRTRSGDAFRTLSRAFGSLRGAIRVSDGGTVRSAFSRIFKESRSGGALSEARIRLLFSLIITDLADACLSEAHSEKDESANSIDDGSLTQAVMEEYIAQKFNKGASLLELSSLIHMSERNTARIFKRYFGATFSEHISNMRLKSAKYLLANTDMSYSAVSAELGFSTYSGFYSFFKLKSGKTPAEYRHSKERD